MKYLKLYEELKEKIEKGDKVIILETPPNFAVMNGYEVGIIYTVGKISDTPINSVFLKNDQSINNGLWFNTKDVRKATPLEIAINKYNL